MEYRESNRHWSTKEDVIAELDSVEGRLDEDVFKSIERRLGTGISRETFSLLVEALIDDGIVEEVATENGILLKCVS